MLEIERRRNESSDCTLKKGPMALTFRLKLWLDLYLYFWPLSIWNEWFIFHEEKNWIHATRKMIFLMFKCHNHNRLYELICIMPLQLKRRLNDNYFNKGKLYRSVSCPTTRENVPETIFIQK